MSGRTALVTGGSGAIGRRLLSELRARGWRVRALVHRRPVPAADEQVTEPGGALRGAQLVVHLAAVTHARSRRAYADVNVGLTATLLAAGAGEVERFVHVSSHAVGPGGGPYADSKRRAEDLVRASGLPYVVVRLPEVYGAGGREGLDRMIAAARAGRPIVVVGRGEYELRPVHVVDAVAVLVAACEADEAIGKTYTVGGPALTLRQAAEACRDAYGSRSPIVSVPEPLLRIAAAAARFVPLPLYPDQPARLRAPRPPASPEVESVLGVRLRSFAEGLKEA